MKFKSRSDWLIHIERFKFRDCGGKTRKFCKKCNQRLSKADAKQHDDHQDCRKLCTICKTTFTTIEKARKHRKDRICVKLFNKSKNKLTCIACRKSLQITSKSEFAENVFCFHFFTFHCCSPPKQDIMAAKQRYRYKCIRCGHIYKSTSAFRHHLYSIHNMELEMFMCSVCPMATCSYDQFLEHTQSAHNDISKQEMCDICSQRLSILTIASHKIEEHDFRRCSTCHELIEKHKLENHFQEVHENLSIQCTICRDVLKSKSDQELHDNLMELYIDRATEKREMETTENSAWLMCPYGNCKTWVHDYSMLKDHINEEHIRASNSDISLQCFKCNATFTDKSTLDAHLMYKVCDSSQIVLKTKAPATIGEVSVGSEGLECKVECTVDTRSDSDSEIDIE